ncbi:MAG TPA: ligase-associated DNA damage response DEXH box helicase [Steroidobacteraceae bacterium]|nr:ligase-associated DNA damage response DEXH box helicase [Steroidobacteraceae bacterium]
MTGHSRFAAALAPIEHWFESQGWQPLEAQRQCWDAYLAGESGLLHAPTGTGKSLAAWFGPVAEALARGDSASSGLQVLWITPLRALANDLQANLTAPLEDLGLDWEVGIRTGDTSTAVRKRQAQRPPAALITTPESLSVMLSFPEAAVQFGRLRMVVVDEWHELLGTKRGTLLELSLARLRRLSPSLRTWGLSATLGNLDIALATLTGRCGRGRLIAGTTTRCTDIETLIPNDVERFPWAGHLGLRLLDGVIAVIEQASSTLVFTNTRAQAELWYQAIVSARLDWLDRVALHHGSIDRSLRMRIEEALREGALKCVVCTSSLDLGVDFSPVEQVVQIGSPKGIARLMQRAGRSGHRPDATSRILCVPTHAFELLEVAGSRQALAAGQIEARAPLVNALDVLAQHLVTVAAGSGFQADEMYEEVRTAYGYRDLGLAEWQWVLDFIVRGGATLSAYPDFRRVVIEPDGTLRLRDRALLRRHRASIGTIPSDSTIELRWMNGAALGTVEESFVGRLKPGDAFLFAGRAVRLVSVRDMVAYVRRATGDGRLQVPRWQGGRMPLSTELADAVIGLLAGRAEHCDHPELRALEPILSLQNEWSELPAPETLLVERLRSREGWHLFCYPFAGRSANEGIAMLAAYRLTRDSEVSITLTANDYGFELLCSAELEFDTGQARGVFATNHLHDDLVECINASEAARRQFRDIARIAGFVQAGLPGRRKSARQLQASSGLIFDVLQQYEPGNPLLKQARDEVLNQQLEARRLMSALERIGSRALRIVDIPRLTPFAFPLWAERLQSRTLSSETWRARVERMVRRLEAASVDRRARLRRA